ncbi:MAG TPA: Hint domain-containing protein, partial [Cytophagales bacterium]
MNRKPLLMHFVARLCALLLFGFAPAAFLPAGAQEKARGLTLDEYKKAKTFTVNDLDNDTYVKFENAYVLDRYEMRPPYVFKYSDGIERRIYLYRLLDNKTKASLGMTAIYVTPGDGKKISVCIPNPQAEKAVWAQYIDDLKEYTAAEKGFGSTFAYVTSRELAALVGGGTGITAASAGKTDFDVCFPAFARVTLADGTEKAIADVRPGDRVASYDAVTGTRRTAVVQAVQVHDRQPYLVQSVVLTTTDLFAAREGHRVGTQVVLQATPNHPVWTSTGAVPLGKLQSGATVQCLAAGT